MLRQWFKIVSVFICLTFSWITPISAAEPIHITFINPGVSDPNDPTGGFWLSVSAFMKAAAEDLNIDLEIMYSERDHLFMKKLAEQVAARAEKPDYLIVVNEKQAAGEIVELVDRAGIKTFIMLNVFTDKQAEKYGQPREKYPNWIGTFIPNNHAAGYQIGKRLIERALEAGLTAQDGKVQIIAIAGDRTTQASIERVKGLEEAVSEYPAADLKPIFYAEWRRDNAQNQAMQALKRYPEASVLWGANDPIALGALDGAVQSGKTPGKDIFIGGLNWDAPALEKIKDGTMVTSVGGHFMTGGWVLVLLHDYHLGKDFADEGVALQYQIFGALHQENIDSYLEHFGDRNWSKIDFTQFSKTFHPEISTYDFSLEAILKQDLK